MKIFISYRREDSAGHTGRLYDSLLAHFGTDRVFMDLSGIDSGQNFVDVIQAAILSSDVLIAVIGKEWLTCPGSAGRRLDDPNDFVRTEIATALERGTPVIPVLIEGTKMPSAAELPDGLKPLSKHDAHELSDERWAYDVGRLIVATEKLAGKPRRLDRRIWMPVAAALVIVAVLGAYFVFRAMQAPGPRDAELYASRGTELLTSGDFDRAIAEFDKAIAIDPRGESYYNRGFAYFSKKDVDKAILDWNQTINLNARDARAYRQRGNAFMTKGDYALALADYDRAIVLEPNDPKAFYNRGMVFRARGEAAKATADFTTVLTLGTDPGAAREAQARLSEVGSTVAPAGLPGTWSADVTYDWGAKYTERFTFKVDGADILGTASFLGLPRGIVNGSLTGDRLRFQTRTQEVAGDSPPKDIVHTYRGTLSNDAIAFYMQSEGGSPSLPIEFTARRASGGKPPATR